MRPNAPVDARSLTSLAGLSAADEQGAHEVLQELAVLGLVTRAGHQWLPRADFHGELFTLAVVFEAIDRYKNEAHRDATEVRVALTQPMHSTTLAAKLNERGWKVAAVEPTKQAFLGLVQRALTRLTIMTPFLDGGGADWLRELIAHTPTGVSINLVLRSLEDESRHDYPSGYRVVRSLLMERGVNVFNYSIGRDGRRRETFHAKVILVDSEIAYVGSANLTAGSREHSMEIGMVVRGKAARELADVVDAVIAAAERWDA